MLKRKTVGLECRALLVVCVVIAVVTQIARPASAQQRPDAEAALKQKINSNTVAILGGSSSGASLHMAHDISRAIGDGDDLRILAVSGKGGTQNVNDILYLEYKDVGFVNIDILNSLKQNKKYAGLKNHISYISKMHNEEFHLISNKKITSIHDLKGKVVAFHGAGSQASGRLLLDNLKIKPAKSIEMSMYEAALRIKSGEVDAILCVTGKPFGGLDRLLKLNSELRLVPIEYAEPLQQVYLPATLTAEDYPGLAEPGQSVNTVAIGAVLAANNLPAGTDRHRGLEKFVKAFFSNFDKVTSRTDRHPKWNDVNLAARLPGWQRFKPAADWLAANSGPLAKKNELEVQFAKFLEMYRQKNAPAQMDPGQREELFRRFVEWQKKRGQ